MKMSDKKVEVTYQGIGFPGLLTILFIALKLTNQIDWDWVWVLSPLWLPLAIILIILGGMVSAAIFTAATIGVREFFRKPK
jgi:uncharacterized integral membrane protein